MKNWSTTRPVSTGMENHFKKYDIVLADPPWKYNARNNPLTKFGKGTPYPTLSIQEICEMCPPTKDDALLFLWTTPPYLPEQLQVMPAWGFRYVTKAFCWVKLNPKALTPFFGIGYYTKSNTEDCYLGVKGRGIKPHSNKVSQLIMSARREHSRKPDEVRDLIDELYPGYEKLEMFSRRVSTPGWDTHGNETLFTE